MAVSLIFTFLSKVIKRVGEKKRTAAFCVEWLQKYNEISYRRCESSKFLTQAFEDCSGCENVLEIYFFIIEETFVRLSVKDSVRV